MQIEYAIRVQLLACFVLTGRARTVRFDSAPMCIICTLLSLKVLPFFFIVFPFDASKIEPRFESSRGKSIH